MNPFAVDVSIRAGYLKDIALECQILNNKYRQAGFYYSIIYYFYFTLSTLLIGTVSVICFLVSTDVFSSNTKKWLTLCAGLISIVVQVMHNLMNGLAIQSKKEAFKNSSKEYGDLINEIKSHQYDSIEIGLLAGKINSKSLKIRKRNRFHFPWFIH